MSIDKKSLRESVTDTAIALPLAWGFSYLTLISMYALDISGALTISVAQTFVLTLVSVIRKYTIRIQFKKREMFKSYVNRDFRENDLAIRIDNFKLPQRDQEYCRSTNEHPSRN